MNSDRKTRTSKTRIVRMLPAGLLKRAVYTCLLLGCCTACGEEENTRPLTVEKYCPLAVQTVNLNEDEVPGRGVLGSGEAIGVFATNASGVTSYTNRYNVRYGSDGTKWTSAAPVLLGNKNAAISAYHPYKNETMTGTSMVLTSQYYQSSADISYAKLQNRNSTSTIMATVNFSMVRAYSQIVFELNRASTYVGNFKLTKVGIKHSGIIGTCYLDVAAGTYSSRIANADFSYIPGGTGIGGSKETTLTSGVLMVPPASAPTGKFTISLTIDGNVNTVDINALPLVAGTKYKVTVKVEGIHKITVSQVTVEDWLAVPITPEYPL